MSENLEWAVFMGGTRDIESQLSSPFLSSLGIARALSFLVENVHGSASFEAATGKVGVNPYYGGVSSSEGARKALFRHYAEELAPREPAISGAHLN